ncbi:uncharacterized protein LOC17898326 [Capsella rubella]|uniref:uncharacterized protein LOC17898326 n=1 Tax=Capsella rubella TaxID=81985 RepID=UPI000CD4C281|nr:uncharacterized protein LOC17898326 [Capsella rubella]
MVKFRVLCCFISCTKIKPSSPPPQVVETGTANPPPQVAKIDKKKPPSSLPQWEKTYMQKPRRVVRKEERVQLLMTL